MSTVLRDSPGCASLLRALLFAINKLNKIILQSRIKASKHLKSSAV